MKNWRKTLIVALGGYFVAALVTGLAIELVLSGVKTESLLKSVEERVPVPISMGDGDFDLLQWFFFRPTVSIADVTIGNPAGFTSPSLLEAREVSARFALLSLLGDEIKVGAFTLYEPQLTIERNRAGRTNLETLFAALSESAPVTKQADAPGDDEKGLGLSIDSFLLESGTVRYLEPGKSEPSLTLHDIHVSVKDFSDDETCRLTFSTGLFSSDSSRLRFSGRGGPFGAGSAPAQGDLSVELAPAEIPDDIRLKYWGHSLADPGSSSRVTLAAAMQGDLIGKLEGTGELTVDDLQVGRDSENRLPMQGRAPLHLVVNNALGAPTFELRMTDADLQLGEGRWRGQSRLRYDGSGFQGGSSGSITDVRIEELLRAFTESGEALFGAAEISQYRLRFAGATSEEIRNSLTGQGQITLGEGRVSMFDLLDTIQRHMKKILGGDSAAEGDTDFVRAESGFEIRDRQVHLANLVLENSSSSITGGGHFTFDEELHIDLVTDVLGGLSSTLGSLVGLSGSGGSLRVPVRVRGTFAEPKVRPDIGSLLKQQVGGLLDLFTKKPEEQQAADPN